MYVSQDNPAEERYRFIFKNLYKFEKFNLKINLLALF